MRHASRKLTAAISVLLLSFGAAAHESGADDTPMRGTMNAAQTEKHVAGWPMESREAIKFMTDKYGEPEAVTKDAVLWGKAGPWKRTIVFRVGVSHNFPMPHTDVMQQWIDYKAPAEKFDELAMYDGSVVVERTAGEISARCDNEAANFLALNLADEVVTGKSSVEDARKQYGEQIMAMKNKQPAPLTEKLTFRVAEDTTDAGQALADM